MSKKIFMHLVMNKMKAAFFILTLLIQLAMVFTLTLLDNGFPFGVTYLCSFIVAVGMRYSSFSSKPIVKDLGWGILYGSTASISLIVAYFVTMLFTYHE